MSQFYLYISSTQQALTLNIHENVLLGRDEGLSTEDTLRVDLSPYRAYTLGVSRRHALLAWEDGKIMIYDLSSSNGTYLNGKKLLPHTGYELEGNDELVLGSFAIRFYMNNQAFGTYSETHLADCADRVETSEEVIVEAPKKIIRLLEKKADGTLAS